jgi:nucleotide-binding universal stress UspA family protein
MLEALARASAIGKVRFAEVLSAESGRLQRGTSVVAVATDFPEATLLALAELRRQHAVTAVWVETGRGLPPPLDHVDALLSVRYSDDWQRREVLELAS